MALALCKTGVIMRIYFAGNFPQMKDPEQEKEVARLVMSRGKSYRRLVSFHFRDDAESLLKIRKELNDENQKG